MITESREASGSAGAACRCAMASIGSAPRGARGGWVGVDIFFVLSGFLVSGLLFAEFKARGQLSPVRFYVRRAWKIYPPFYLLLVVTVIMYATVRQELRWSWLLSEMLFVQG